VLRPKLEASRDHWMTDARQVLVSLLP